MPEYGQPIYNNLHWKSTLDFFKEEEASKDEFSEFLDDEYKKLGDTDKEARDEAVEAFKRGEPTQEVDPKGPYVQSQAGGSRFAAPGDSDESPSQIGPEYSMPPRTKRDDDLEAPFNNSVDIDKDMNPIEAIKNLLDRSKGKKDIKIDGTKTMRGLPKGDETQEIVEKNTEGEGIFDESVPLPKPRVTGPDHPEGPGIPLRDGYTTTDWANMDRDDKKVNTAQYPQDPDARPALPYKRPSRAKKSIEESLLKLMKAPQQTPPDDPEAIGRGKKPYQSMPEVPGADYPHDIAHFQDRKINQERGGRDAGRGDKEFQQTAANMQSHWWGGHRKDAPLPAETPFTVTDKPFDPEEHLKQMSKLHEMMEAVNSGKVKLTDEEHSLFADRMGQWMADQKQAGAGLQHDPALDYKPENRALRNSTPIEESLLKLMKDGDQRLNAMAEDKIKEPDCCEDEDILVADGDKTGDAMKRIAKAEDEEGHFDPAVYRARQIRGRTARQEHGQDDDVKAPPQEHIGELETFTPGVKTTRPMTGWKFAEGPEGKKQMEAWWKEHFPDRETDLYGEGKVPPPENPVEEALFKLMEDIKPADVGMAKKNALEIDKAAGMPMPKTPKVSSLPQQAPTMSASEMEAQSKPQEASQAGVGETVGAITDLLSGRAKQQVWGQQLTANQMRENPEAEAQGAGGWGMANQRRQTDTQAS